MHLYIQHTLVTSTLDFGPIVLSFVPFFGFFGEIEQNFECQLSLTYA